MKEVVHVVDDHASIRRSLALLLQAAGHAVVLHETGEALLQAAEAGLEPGCIILDVRMPGRDGLMVMEMLARQHFTLPVIIVTGHGDIPLAVRAMRAGARDFIEKPYPEERILGAVEEALAAGRVAVDEKARAAEAQARIATLTPREREVLAALVSGQSNKGTAAKLGISPRTVEVHRAHLMEKLGVRSLPEAVRMYLAAGVPQDS
jgi:two-component system, LuxR family, response regulator FixJ